MTYPKRLFWLDIQKAVESSRDGNAFTAVLLDRATWTFLKLRPYQVFEDGEIEQTSAETVLIGPVALERYWCERDTWIARDEAGELWLRVNAPPEAQWLE